MEALPIIWVALGVVLLLILNMKFKINGMLALLLAAMFVGVCEWLPLEAIGKSIENGVGSTLGHLALIILFGAILGKLMVDSGAAQRVSSTLLKRFGPQKVQWAILVIGLIFGLAMFYEVAFLILAPLVISIAREAKIPFLKLGITMVAAATTAHSLFPPQLGPTALVTAFHADMGMVYIYGIIVAVPTVICSGILLPKLLGNLDRPIPELLESQKVFSDDEMPSFAISLFAFDVNRGRSMSDVMKSYTVAIEKVAMVVFIIGAGGAFKQIIMDTGVGDYIADMMRHSSVSPLIMAWFITVLLRLATGAGTVSAITAAGIVGPMITIFNVNRALMVLATASGSNTLTHVNDAAFWLFKEYFGLSIKDTFKTWGLLELANSVVGLLIVLLLSLVV
ncbi:SLC13 family permease [Candidatus Symbiopectobacterium sp. 'North America']|uniref:GntT/GntP/DsdX family permease n=1 Tax=Candidatus Symbiopectobacterium sp. 'North America' TaxID=2794574 RepID=UPI0018CA2E22|nr:SLC13 family permease [Candidatus Symbiopectobacterium sp. 'North America']